MKPEDIKNKKIAVLCDTLEKANKFLEICFQTGNEGARDVYKVFGIKLCMCLTGNSVRCMTKKCFTDADYAIITFEQFIGEDENDQPLSTEEVLGVLVNEYANGKYDEIFGCDPYFEELTSRFTPAEIVQKVTEWKRKQNKQIRVTEDMIADALDEKYGIGNWGRK